MYCSVLGWALSWTHAFADRFQQSFNEDNLEHLLVIYIVASNHLAPQCIGGHWSTLYTICSRHEWTALYQRLFLCLLRRLFTFREDSWRSYGTTLLCTFLKLMALWFQCITGVKCRDSRALHEISNRKWVALSCTLFESTVPLNADIRQKVETGSNESNILDLICTYWRLNYSVTIRANLHADNTKTYLHGVIFCGR